MSFEGPKPLIIRRADFLLRQPRPDMLIGNFLARSGVAVLASPPYAGKTFLALEAMRAVAYGTPFLGHFPVPRAGNSLYLGNDSPAWDLAAQFDKLVGLPDPLEAEHLIRTGPLGSFGFIFDHTFMLNSGSDAARVVLAAQQHASLREHFYLGGEEHAREVGGTSLIVIDTLRSVHGFEENDNTAMQHMMNLLRYIASETGAAVLALHHFNKAPKESVDMSLDRLRGATCIGGAVDSVYALTGKAPHISVKVLKNRPAPEQGDFKYRMQTSGARVSLTYDSSAPKSPISPENLARLVQFLRDRGTWVPLVDIELWIGSDNGVVEYEAFRKLTEKCLTFLEKSGTVVRIHGAARLATRETESK